MARLLQKYLVCIALKFHISKSLKRILNQLKQLYAPLYHIYLRTILYHYNIHAQTLSLDRHSNCNFICMLHIYHAQSHAAPDNANLEISVLSKSSSFCPRLIPHFKSSYSNQEFFLAHFRGGGDIKFKTPTQNNNKINLQISQSMFLYKTETGKILNEMTARI